MSRNKTRDGKRDNPLSHLVLALVAAFQIFPLAAMFVNSLRTD